MLAGLLAASALLVVPAAAQSAGPRLRWRPVGNTSLATGLSSNAGGPVETVWFQSDSSIAARLPGGRVFLTADLESWRRDDGAQPPAILPDAPAAAVAPERGAKVRAGRSGSNIVYAAGRHAWKSTDGGLNWTNLSLYKGESILGGAIRELAVDPSDEQRIVAATDSGVWFSTDGGLSWQGLNDGLPNLPVRRILAAPAGTRGVVLGVAQSNGGLTAVEWAPAQKLGWLPASDEPLRAEAAAKRQLSAALGSEITAAASNGDSIFAGDVNGKLWASADAGRTWRSFAAAESGARVERFWLDPADRSFALVALSGQSGQTPGLMRTLNGGGYWDDLSANLPSGTVYGVTADRTTGAVYAATDKGLYLTYADLRAPAPPTAWQPIGAGLPEAAARDVRIDSAGNLLLAALDGYGVYAVLAPHRQRAPQLAHSADYAVRPAAPGALLSVVGARAATVTAGGSAAPVLAASDEESQVQVPFEVTGDSMQLVVNAAQGRVVFGLPLRAAAPAILIDRDGTPMLLDAFSGAQLDLLNPARPGMKLQLLMSGLGKVQPEWPTGLQAPLEDAPRVTVPLKASLNGVPLRIGRATLAPGYIGYYLVELDLPDLLDSGASELVVEAAGVESNRVRVYVGQ
ncbi:MAG: hypothetical protein HY821_10980 [Acidobacteria bacterium]|nr:hypothetical protein [Acidobacteriota bacterium]